MTPDVTVRVAKIEELPEVARLFSKILSGLPYSNSLAKKHEIQKYTAARLTEKLPQDPYSVLVATEKTGKIVGFCFNRFDDFTIWIDWFGVEPSERNKGVGMAILQATFETAGKRGAHKVWCDSGTSNEPSKNLLRKAGFREIVEIKKHWYEQDFILWERFV